MVCLYSCCGSELSEFIWNILRRFYSLSEIEVWFCMDRNTYRPFHSAIKHTYRIVKGSFVRCLYIAAVALSLVNLYRALFRGVLLNTVDVEGLKK